MTDTAPAKTRPLRLILALATVALVLLAGFAWLNRRALAREALTGWLNANGVAADAEVEAFGPGIFIARLRIGDPKNPDFAAERAEVRFRARITGLEVISVVLRKPVLRAQLRRDGLHAGALDPLVQAFLRRPPRPNVKQPRIRIDDGVLVLTTDYGDPLRVTADALVDDGKLQRLKATSAPVRLKDGDVRVSLGAGSLQAVTRAGRIDLAIAAPVMSATTGAAGLEDGALNLTAQLPYPDLQKRRGDGAVVAALRLTGRRVVLAGQALDGAELKAGLTGQAKGWVPDLTFRGKASASILASAGHLGIMEARAVRLAATSQDVSWDRKPGDRIAATLKLNGGVDGLTAGDLRLSPFTVTAEGPVSAAASGIQAAFDGAAVGQGSWSGLGRVTAQDTPDIAAIKRAAAGFKVAAPGFSVRLKDGAATVALAKPVRVATAGGGVVELAGRATAPVLGPSGGAFRLAVKGGGLPAIEADVAKLVLTDGGMTASGRVRARASIGFVRSAEIDATGRLQSAAGSLRFDADRCVDLKADRLDFDANDVESVSGRLCQVGGQPLFRMAGGDWRIAGRAQSVAASATFAQARMIGGAGRIAAQSRRGELTAQAHIDTARQEDTAPDRRFNPVLMTGDANLAGFIWRANLAFKLPNGAPLGAAQVTQDSNLGRGGVVIQTAMLDFAEGALQPDQISPLASTLGSPVTGQARFNGRFDWTPDGATSSGVIRIPRLDFQSPAGPVKGLSGELVFASLAPLTAAPGQELAVAQVQGPILVEHLRATFGVADNLLRVAGGEADVGGGKVRVETLEIPLVPGAPTRGILRLEGVQLHDLVEASPFGDKVEFDAKVSGRIPFEVIGDRVRISGGEVTAIQPGRISIARAALTGVSADTAVTAPSPVVDPNATFTDFAYQAMENLAFDTLEASIASQPDGRLGVIFHIVGRHDPPTKQKIKLTVMDLIRKRFLGRPLPLPSGTGVNLTLDTTLNLDDLLADYAEYQKARSSGPVQP